MDWMTWISDLGDSAVLLPLSILLVVALWHYQSRSAAAAFVWAWAFCVAAVVVLKVIFIGCGPTWNFGIVSPSGHASVSAAVYGAYGIVVARQVSRWQRFAVLGVSALFVLGVSVSRIILGQHSPAEVGLGLTVGAVAVGLFTVRYLRLQTAKVNLLLLVPPFLGLLLALHGVRLPIEEFIQRFAVITRTSTGACPGSVGGSHAVSAGPAASS